VSPLGYSCAALLAPPGGQIGLDWDAVCGGSSDEGVQCVSRIQKTFLAIQFTNLPVSSIFLLFQCLHDYCIHSELFYKKQSLNTTSEILNNFKKRRFLLKIQKSLTIGHFTPFLEDRY
jgi:hypothetical protein